MKDMKHTAEHCHACETPGPVVWWKDQALWGLALMGSVLALGALWAPARPAAHGLWMYIAKAGWAIALGLVLGGLIDHFVPKEYISLWLTGRHKRIILASAGFGFLASSCSHGCLALSMELYKKGASVPAVITFLLASPWASLSLTLLIVSLMGWAGLLIVLLALLVAVTTGFVFQKLERKGLIEPNPHTVKLAEGFSIVADLRRRFAGKRWTGPGLLADLRGVAKGTRELSRMVLFWVALGFTMSALIGAYVPAGWWTRFAGPSLLGLLTTMGVAAALEVCSEGTAPVAVELYRRTGAIGNAFAFLMGGVVTDFTELSLVWANLGRRVVGWLLVVTLPQVFLLGWLMNWIVRN